MELLLDGLLLMVLGMSAVFSFLGVMVCVMVLSARLVSGFSHLLPERTPPAKPARKPPASRTAAAPAGDGALLAVIGAAVRMYRDERG